MICRAGHPLSTSDLKIALLLVTPHFLSHLANDVGFRIYELPPMLISSQKRLGQFEITVTPVFDLVLDWYHSYVIFGLPTKLISSQNRLGHCGGNLGLIWIFFWFIFISGHMRHSNKLFLITFQVIQTSETYLSHWVFLYQCIWLFLRCSRHDAVAFQNHFSAIFAKIRFRKMHPKSQPATSNII